MAHIGSYCKETRIGVMHCNIQWKNSGGYVLFTFLILSRKKLGVRCAHKHSNSAEIEVTEAAVLAQIHRRPMGQ